MTNQGFFNNEGQWDIEGQIDLSAAAAVVASRGSNATVTKTATGTYTVVLPGSLGILMFEILNATTFYSGTVPAAALGNRVASVVQSAADGSITITLKTSAAATSGADTDTTAATTLNYRVALRIQRIGNPFP